MPSEAIARQTAGVPLERLLKRWGDPTARVIAFGLGAVFLWAAFWKAVDPRGTQAAFAYLVGDGRRVSVATVSLVYGEVFLGAALVAGVGLRWTLLAGAAVLCVFAGWLVWLTINGIALGCGCALAAGTSDLVGWFDVLRTGGLAGLSVGGAALLRPVAVNHCFEKEMPDDP